MTIVLKNSGALLHPRRARQLIVTTITVLRFVSQDATYFNGRLISRTGTASQFIPVRYLTSVPSDGVTDVKVTETIQGRGPIMFRVVRVVIPKGACRRCVPLRGIASSVNFRAAVRGRGALRRLEIRD